MIVLPNVVTMVDWLVRWGLTSSCTHSVRTVPVSYLLLVVSTHVFRLYFSILYSFRKNDVLGTVFTYSRKIPMALSNEGKSADGLHTKTACIVFLRSHNDGIPPK